MKVKFKRKKEPVNTTFKLPGDKSIAHRALIIGALGKGDYVISNFPRSLDCMSTLCCMKEIGVSVEVDHDRVHVSSPGYKYFLKKAGVLNSNNSGTTARLISGLVAGCGIECSIDGDNSLRKRPMDRVIDPLKLMGAKIEAEKGLLPMTFKSNKGLTDIEYLMPVSSAQVKSCILIAGFLGKGKTKVIEKESSRDHTERMFSALGADIHTNGKEICIKNSLITVKDMHIPGDISSAAFLIACAILSEAAEIVIRDVLLNQGRRKYLDMLKKMGANLEYKVNVLENGEEAGDIFVKSSKLRAIIISEEEVPNIIDEIPMLSVLAAFSSGKTIIRGINELKFKESNRVKAIVENLRLSGINVTSSGDCIEIMGTDEYISKDICINPYNDHRIALAFTALALRNLRETVISNWECTNISFPNAIEYFKEFAVVSIHE